MMIKTVPWLALGMGLAAALVPPPATSAADFPPITAEEKALTSVPGEPNAPAVVLFRKGVFRIEQFGKQSASLFTVRARIKILTEQGKEYGEMELRHTSSERLKSFKGRAVLPDGRILELSDKDVFKRRTSELDKVFVTAVAFPSVEVGAFLDYEYELVYETVFELDPWYFQDRIPTLFSQISYEVPEHIGFRPWARVLPDRFEEEIEKQPRGRIVHARMTNLPSVPREPYGYPLGDLSSQYLILPTEYVLSGRQTDLLVSWPRACDIMQTVYHDYRKNGGQATKKARELAAGAKDQRGQADAVYGFLRDQIGLESATGIFVRRGASVDGVLASGRGNETDKALVLQAMLEALKIDADLVWVADRAGGRVDMNTPNPGWFDHAIVRARVDGGEIFLDPSDSRLGFGQLAPGLEGTQALLYHPRKPEVITLPETSFDQNVRRAEVELALDDDGRLSGRGVLELRGHHAWRRLRWTDDPEAAWKNWLEESFEDFTIADLEVSEEVDDRLLKVAWTMAQPEEEVLGDEVSVRPCRPLGPVDQPFDGPRRTPVWFPFADRDEVELRITWPEGWAVDVTPRVANHTSDAGAVVAEVEHDAAGRRLSYSRRFDIRQRDVATPTLLRAVHTLYNVVEHADGQDLVLVRR